LSASQQTKYFVAAFCVFNCFAQTEGQPSAERFDVASVRLASEESLHFDGPRMQFLHGSLIAHALTLRACILWAYEMQAAQVIGPDFTIGVSPAVRQQPPPDVLDRRRAADLRHCDRQSQSPRSGVQCSVTIT
jgi:hypothetical protein